MMQNVESYFYVNYAYIHQIQSNLLVYDYLFFDFSIQCTRYNISPHYRFLKKVNRMYRNRKRKKKRTSEKNMQSNTIDGLVLFQYNFVLFPTYIKKRIYKNHFQFIRQTSQGNLATLHKLYSTKKRYHAHEKKNARAYT